MSSPAIVWLIARREISTKLRDRAFLIATGLFLVIIAGIVTFNVISARGSSSYTVGIVGSPDPAYEKVVETAADQQGLDVSFRQYNQESEAEQAVRDDDVDAAVNGDTLVTNSGGDAQLRALLEAAHQATTQADQISDSGLDPAQVKQALTVAPYESKTLQADADNSTERGVVAIIAVGIVYFLLVTTAQFVAQGVVEEKASRVVELLMATVKPWQLLAGKVLGLGLLGLAQTALILGVGAAIGLGAGLVDVPTSTIGTVVQVLAWFVLGYAFFASLFAAGASLVSRQEDLGSAIGALSMIPLFAFFGAFATLNNPTGIWATVLSICPGFSPISMPVRSAMTSVPIWQYLLAIVLQLVAIGLIVRLAGRVYAGAMLRTGGKVKLREALANADSRAD